MSDWELVPQGKGEWDLSNEVDDKNEAQLPISPEDVAGDYLKSMLDRFGHQAFSTLTSPLTMLSKHFGGPEINIPESTSQAVSTQIPLGFTEGARSVLSGLLGKTEEPIHLGGEGQSLQEQLARNLSRGLTKSSPEIAAATLTPGTVAPYLTTALASYLTTPGSKQDRAITAAESIPEQLAAKGVAKAIGKTGESAKAWYNRQTPKQIYTKIQSTYDKNNEMLSKLFDFVGDEARKRGIDTVKNVPIDAIEQSRRFLPKTDATKELIAKAKTGDYQSLRDLFSDMRRHASLARANPLQADTGKADILDQNRNKIHKALIDHFNKNQSKDLSQWLNYAKKGYANLKNIYESEPVISKLVTGKREVPKTLTALKKDNLNIDRLLKAHPEVASDLKNLEIIEKTKGPLKKAGIATGGYLGIDKLKKELMGYDNN